MNSKDKVDSTESSQNNTETKLNSGWNNLIHLIALFSISRFILINVLEFGLIAIFPWVKYSLKDCLTVAIFACFNFGRTFPILFSRNDVFSYIYIIMSEFLNTFLIYKHSNDVILSCLCHSVSMFYTLKMFSFVFSSQGNEYHRFLDFMIFPTMVYKDSYLRKSKTNYLKILQLLIKFVVFLCSFFILLNEYTLPAFHRLLRFKSINEILESYLNFSVAMVIQFYIFFRMLFDHICGIISELTLFDEIIYGGWWNSTTSEEFWRTWNIPVHNYIKNHIYKPLKNKGYNSHTSALICFLFSGIVHEYVISFSLKHFNGWLFVGMMLQILLHYITKYLKKYIPELSNYFFWILFCFIGQPIFTILIYIAYYHNNLSS